MRNLLDAIEKTLRQSVKQREDNTHHSFVSIILEKLPQEVTLTLEQNYKTNETWTVQDLCKALNNYVALHERVSTIGLSFTTQQQQKLQQQQQYHPYRQSTQPTQRKQHFSAPGGELPEKEFQSTAASFQHQCTDKSVGVTLGSTTEDPKVSSLRRESLHRRMSSLPNH